MMVRIFLVCSLLFTSINTFAFDAGKFFQKTCTQCHTIGGGDKIGPDLAGLSKRRKVDWIVKFVNYPDGMINGDAEEEGYEKPDPLAKKIYAAYKPQMMAEQEVTKVQVEAILKYIDSLKKQPKGKILTIK
ncbi:MAG: protein SCO1/2 [Bacteriovoracaceae bacterium]|jgi:protein SCO1/2